MERQSGVLWQRIQRSTTHGYARRTVSFNMNPGHDIDKSMIPHSAQCLSSACSPLQYARVPLTSWGLPHRTIESNPFQRYGTSRSVPSVSSLISSPFHVRFRLALNTHKVEINTPQFLSRCQFTLSLNLPTYSLRALICSNTRLGNTWLM